VRALERSAFNVADAATLLASDPTAALYVAAILAGRLDAANCAIVEVKHQLEAGTPRAAVARAVDKITQLLSNESFAEDLFLDELIAKPWDANTGSTPTASMTSGNWRWGPDERPPCIIILARTRS